MVVSTPKHWLLFLAELMTMLVVWKSARLLNLISLLDVTGVRYLSVGMAGTRPLVVLKKKLSRSFLLSCSGVRCRSFSMLGSGRASRGAVFVIQWEMKRAARLWIFSSLSMFLCWY